jgi:hypothetical protein
MSNGRRVHVLAAARAPDPVTEERPVVQLSPANDADLARLIRFVERLAGAQFFGRLTLSFQNGRITDLRTEQSMKIDEI